MKIKINIEYDAEREEGETVEDEERVLDVVGDELKTYVEAIRRGCEAERLRVNVST
jgi:hypothetical protein